MSKPSSREFLGWNDWKRQQELNKEAISTPTQFTSPQLTSQQYFNNVSNPGDYQSNFFSDMTSLGFVPKVDDYAKAPTMLSNPYKAPTAHHGYNQPARQPDDSDYFDHLLKENLKGDGISAADHLGLNSKAGLAARYAKQDPGYDADLNWFNEDTIGMMSGTGLTNVEPSKGMFSDMTGKDWLGAGLGAANLGLGIASYRDNRKALKEQIKSSKQNRDIMKQEHEHAKSARNALSSAATQVFGPAKKPDQV